MLCQGGKPEFYRNSVVFVHCFCKPQSCSWKGEIKGEKEANKKNGSPEVKWSWAQKQKHYQVRHRFKTLGLKLYIRSLARTARSCLMNWDFAKYPERKGHHRGYFVVAAVTVSENQRVLTYTYMLQTWNSLTEVKYLCVWSWNAAFLPWWSKASELQTFPNNLGAVSSSYLPPLAWQNALIGCHLCLAEALFMDNSMLKKRWVVLGIPQCIKANMMRGDSRNPKRDTITSSQTLVGKEYSVCVLRRIRQWVISSREIHLLFFICKSKRPSRSTEKKKTKHTGIT